MSFDKPLPVQVFGEEPMYVAIRLDAIDIRSPLTGMGLSTIASFPGRWTWVRQEEVVAKVMGCSGDGSVPDDAARVKELEAALKTQRDLGLYAAEVLAQLERTMRAGVIIPNVP